MTFLPLGQNWFSMRRSINQQSGATPAGNFACASDARSSVVPVPRFVQSRHRKLANRFEECLDPFKIVIVRDMRLTGFDALCLHTTYPCKQMRGHKLMQTIAHVNRVFRDKPGGLVADCLGLAEETKEALAIYTESGGTGNTCQELGHRLIATGRLRENRWMGEE